MAIRIKVLATNVTLIGEGREVISLFHVYCQRTIYSKPVRYGFALQSNLYNFFAGFIDHLHLPEFQLICLM